MKSKTILLVCVLVAIIGLIVYFEKTTPTTKTFNGTAEISVASQDPQTEARINLKQTTYQRAKELVQPEGYINGENITLAEYLGEKVILVDFWTYSCINCQRTLPYLTQWYEEYKDNGLVIIGVHTPEFEFEKKYDNVLKATKKWSVTYPVVLDNDRQIWQAYKNRFWPRKYLIDIDGFIVYDHIGEGGYTQTEAKIRELLQERNAVLGLNQEIETNSIEDVENPEFGRIKTSEIYFGYEFQRGQMGNTEGWLPEKTVLYTLPVHQEKNYFYLDGNWKNNPDNMELVSSTGKIVLKYEAKTINLVAGSSTRQQVNVLIDGQRIDSIEISDFDLYPLFTDEDYREHTIELEIPAGVMVYTFTFG